MYSRGAILALCCPLCSTAIVSWVRDGSSDTYHLSPGAPHARLWSFHNPSVILEWGGHGFRGRSYARARTGRPSGRHSWDSRPATPSLWKRRHSSSAMGGMPQLLPTVTAMRGSGAGSLFRRSQSHKPGALTSRVANLASFERNIYSDSENGGEI